MPNTVLRPPPISADLPLLAQSLPGQKFRFRRAEVEEAQEIYLAERRRIQELREKINAASRVPAPVKYYSVVVNGNTYCIQLQRLPDDGI